MVTYDGDVKLIYSSGDLDISIADGQPTMDEGLENAVTTSLFFDSNWWGNAPSVADESGPVGSKFMDITKKQLTNRTRQDAEATGTAALAWMVSEGIAQSATVEASIPSVGRLDVVAKIQQPDRTVAIRYQINWQAMQARVA